MLRCCTILSCSVLFVVFAAAADAGELYLDVSATHVTNTKPLVITVSGIGQCPSVSDPIISDGVILLEFSDGCPILPPSPGPFAYHFLAGPLEPGIWEVQLIDLTIIVTPPPVVATVEVTVTDPRYAIELTPSPATVDDEVVASLTYFGACVFNNPPEITPGHIRIELNEAGICDPPPLPGIFMLDIFLGQLAAGEYLAELVYEGYRVAETQLSVLPSGACVPGSSTLCLNDGRFRVQASWVSPSDGGTAIAVGETDDAGFFWFTSPSNIELVVKVLDACHTPFQSFWVFASGLTNLGVDLVVTDTVTGATKSYQNPLGTRFETIADTAAFPFPACP